MVSPHENKRPAAVFLAIAVMMGIGAPLAADPRTDHLVNMLENGSSYRVRVQAATTLGRIRARDAVPALVRALSDDSELVVVSVAAALQQIGDTGVIGDLEAASTAMSSEAARSQIEATLRVLRALTPEGDTTRVAATRPSLLVRIDAMGNSSGVQRDDLPEVMRELVVSRLSREPGVIIQDPSLEPAEVRKKLAAERLEGVILSGSVLRLERVGDRLIVRISLNVFSNPDYNLLLMPSAESAIPLPGGSLPRDAERAAQGRALRAVTESLLESIVERLRDSGAR